MIRFVCPCKFEFRDLLEFEEHCAKVHGQAWLYKYTEPQRRLRIMEEVWGPEGHPRER